MKKLDLKKVAFAAVTVNAMLCVALAVGVSYGGYLLFEIDPGFPGYVAFSVVAVRIFYDVSLSMHSAILDFFRELDIKKEDTTCQ